MLEWLLLLPRAGRRPLGEALGRLVEPALAEIDVLAPEAPLLGELAGRSRQALAVSSELALETVFEHGDLSHPNLLWSELGGLGIVDWELGRADGLPLHDLTLFVGYLVGTIARAAGDSAVVAAFEDAVLAPEGWARPILAEYAARMDLPAGAVGPLVVAAWARLLGGLPARAAEPGALTGSEDAARRELASWIAAHRYAGLLRAALDGWSSLAAIEGRG